MTMNSIETATLGVSIAFPIFALVFVILRFAARRVRSTPPKADDWAVVVALVGCFFQQYT